jgi:poly-gamma-glutamate synthesis protein (capsule biosynthesis protein)
VASNYPLSYKLTWLPRFLKPSLGGGDGAFAPPAQALLRPMPASTVRLAFVGDISAVASRGLPIFDPVLAEVLSGADLIVGNCESPVVRRVTAKVGTGLGLRHAMTRSFLEGALEAAGVEARKLVLSLANNHALDQGADGFDETVATLGEMGIRPIGTVANGALTRIKAGPLTVGFAAFTQWRNASHEMFAGRVMMDPDGWLNEGREGIDLLVAVPHWDREFRHFPQAETRETARRLAAQGAGLIAGHHTHVVQPVERIGDSVAAYGLGDFLGTVFVRQPWPGRIGAILIADISTESETLGKVAAYRTQFFYRLREGAREQLLPLEALAGTMKNRVDARLAAIFPA